MTTPPEATHPNRGTTQSDADRQVHNAGASSDANGDMNVPLEHRVYDCFDSAGEIRDAWDALAAEEGDFFGSFDWCALWWKHYGSRRRLEIHVFVDGDQLVGVAPLFREELAAGPLRVRALRIVGCDHSTATAGLLLHRNQAEKVLAMLVDKITRGDGWDLIHFGRLPGYFAHTDVLVRLLGSACHVGQVEQIRNPHPHTLIDLPGSFDAYLKGLSYRERHNIRKESRRLSSEHGLMGMDAACDGGAQAAVERFIEFHQAQWTEKGHQGHFEDWPGARAFHADVARAAARSGRLVMREVRADDQMLSMAYAFRFGRRIHWFLAARSMDPRWHFCFPGRVGACDLVKTAIEQGCSQIDMGIGYYPYKLKLGGRLHPLVSIAVTHAGTSPALRVWILRKIALLHDLVGYRLWYQHLAPSLPWRRSGLIRRWIRLRIWPSDSSRLLRHISMIWCWPASLFVRGRRRMREALGVSRCWSLLFHQYRKVFLRHHVVFSIHAGESLVPAVPPADFEVKEFRSHYEVDEKVKNAIIAHGGRFIWLEYEASLLAGDVLWVSYIGGEPAGVCWSTCPENAEDYFVPLGRKGVLVRKCLTLPQFRRRGVYTATLQHMIRSLAACGTERIFIDCRSWNTPSVRGIERAGFTRLAEGKQGWFGTCHFVENVES